MVKSRAKLGGVTLGVKALQDILFELVSYMRLQEKFYANARLTLWKFASSHRQCMSTWQVLTYLEFSQQVETQSVALHVRSCMMNHRN